MQGWRGAGTADDPVIVADSPGCDWGHEAVMLQLAAADLGTSPTYSPSPSPAAPQRAGALAAGAEPASAAGPTATAASAAARSAHKGQGEGAGRASAPGAGASIEALLKKVEVGPGARFSVSICW
jgi:hypothetical protein